MAKPTPKKTTPATPTEAEVKGYEPQTIWQRLKTDPFIEDFDFDPKCPNFFYASNLIQRTIARLVGKTPTGYVPIAAQHDGRLITVTAGGALENYEAKTGTGTDDGAIETFTNQVSRLDILIFDNPAYLKLSKNLTDPLGDQLELWKDSFLSIDLRTQKVWIQNRDAGSNCRYCLIGYW
jgi:hypothetical protein